MIQFNLLPDIKVQYIKTMRTKRMVMVTAIALTAVCVAMMFLLFSYRLIKSQQIKSLDKNIGDLTQELNNMPELTKVLSVQHQLNALPQLYNGRPATDRLPVFIDQTTPTEVSLTDLSLDFATRTIEISGEAKTLEEVNSYIDTMKYTTFSVTNEPGVNRNPFITVVLKEFARTEESATFTISMNFEPTIFDITKEVKLSVPNLVTTRAQVPGAELFKAGEGHH